jgi:DNA polymerase elongation subunit (family B)
MSNTNITTLHAQDEFAAVIDLLGDANFQVEHEIEANGQTVYWLTDGLYATIHEVEAAYEYDHRMMFNSGFYRIVSEDLRDDDMQEIEKLYFVAVYESEEVLRFA